MLAITFILSSFIWSGCKANFLKIFKQRIFVKIILEALKLIPNY
jgi:hypothetical protein